MTIPGISKPPAGTGGVPVPFSDLGHSYAEVAAPRFVLDFCTLQYPAPNDQKPTRYWIDWLRKIGYFAATNLTPWAGPQQFSLMHVAYTFGPAARPAETLTLFRGSTPDRQANISWTDNLRFALNYALNPRYHAACPHVYRAEVEPERVLGFVQLASGDPGEYLVDTNGLDIVDHFQIKGEHLS
ncbi:hypothetical protein BH09ACT6_BH09ACT6_18700 [soil metagenome]